MKILHLIFVPSLVISLAGCAAFSPNEVADPSHLTIDNAMQSIGEGFIKMQAALSGNKMGLWPCRVTTTLNVTANADQGGKLVLDTTIKPPSEVVTAEIKGHAEQTNNSSATRGNTISVEMYNAACIPKDTIGYDKPDKVDLVVKALENSKTSSPLFLELNKSIIENLNSIEKSK
jgi:hypothetical protein